jgi:hypothetical protein
MADPGKVPTRDECAEMLRKLIHGEISRSAVSDWAEPWLTRFDLIDDRKIRRAIVQLSGADFPTTDRPYLHGREDFEAWLRELIS